MVKERVESQGPSGLYYRRSEKNWRALIAGVESCRDRGMVVWLYDEDEYPSGAARGRFTHP